MFKVFLESNSTTTTMTRAMTTTSTSTIMSAHSVVDWNGSKVSNPLRRGFLFYFYWSFLFSFVLLRAEVYVSSLLHLVPRAHTLSLIGMDSWWVTLSGGVSYFYFYSFLFSLLLLWRPPTITSPLALPPSVQPLCFKFLLELDKWTPGQAGNLSRWCIEV